MVTRWFWKGSGVIMEWLTKANLLLNTLINYETYIIVFPKNSNFINFDTRKKSPLNRKIRPINNSHNQRTFFTFCKDKIKSCLKIYDIIIWPNAILKNNRNTRLLNLASRKKNRYRTFQFQDFNLKLMS